MDARNKAIEELKRVVGEFCIEHRGLDVTVDLSQLLDKYILEEQARLYEEYKLTNN